MCSSNPTIVKFQNGVYSAFKVHCNSWSCPDCAPRRRQRLIREAREGSPVRFITLTVNPHWFGSPEERAAQLAKAWRLAVASYRHRWPHHEAEYLAVFEATAKGEPHLHIIWRGGFVPQKWLSAQMNKRIGAPIVDVRRVHGQDQVIRYISKYISKRSIRFGTCKRYWSSRGWVAKSPRQLRKERNAGAIFGRTKRHITTVLEEWIAAGLSLSWDHGSIRDATLPPGRASPPGFWLVDGELVDMDSI